LVIELSCVFEIIHFCFSGDMTQVWGQDCLNQTQQGEIPYVATIAELDSCDWFAENTEFIAWCNTMNNLGTNNNYVQNTGNAANSRLWDLVNVSETFLQPPHTAAITIPHCARNSDIKLFTVLNFLYSKLVKDCFIIRGCPRLGELVRFDD
jgi:hypothetical protein